MASVDFTEAPFTRLNTHSLARDFVVDIAISAPLNPLDEGIYIDRIVKGRLLTLDDYDVVVDYVTVSTRESKFGVMTSLTILEAIQLVLDSIANRYALALLSN